MAQAYVIGRITADLEMKTSSNGNPYVRFDIAETIGNTFDAGIEVVHITMKYAS